MNVRNILFVENLNKSYHSSGKSLAVLSNISLSIEEGSSVSIVGPSGSGKTTLLGLCAGLDRSDTGSISLAGIRIDQLNEDRRAAVRNEHVGFVFQNFQLLPTLTAIENVMVPLELRGEKNVRSRALQLLDQVGLAERAQHYPNQLSGGEQQRVSLARAFSNDPKVLFADEPTGNLDTETSEKIIRLLFDLNRQRGTTLIMVTHDLDLAARTQRIIRLKSGTILSDQYAKQ